MSSPTNHYDVIIVGAGVAGCALAQALSSLKRPSPLRICLLERSLAEPDRIVGELLQPGGVEALRRLGMTACLEGIDAVPVRGYCVMLDGKPVHIPYPDGYEGRSFHHGRFIQSLRKKARAAPGVDTVEATVSELVECPTTGRVLGVRATRKVEGTEQAGEKETFLADLTIVADGCFSNFRNAVLGGVGMKPVTKSHFVGIVLEDAELPIPKHGTVVLVRGHGPALLYQIAGHDTRMLVDLKTPLPSDIKQVILDEITPQLPTALQVPVQNALANDRLRRMPNTFLPPAEQGQHTKEGVFLIGDSWNMRHPLTGGGMTVAFNDVVVLQDLLRDVNDFGDWRQISHVLHRWHWRRKQFASTINILSVALYDLFGADDESLEVLRMGCFKYFELGGECIRGPVSLLAGIEQSTMMLARHFFAVALYAIWAMFAHPRRVIVDEKPVYLKPSIEEYPFLLFKCIRVFWTACVVFLPLVWTEIRWW
ncbi:SE-domain-containing protein [Daedalea quercina L-15889]|uniref:Squalene monooxygenase n=1 Tax=Daedalea quercina L-15889 TaxID=1314783 RepID=A0A165NGB4_9APHY|nr:SE-domain-containing protein [Daedalea quercina L-15889]